jgi:hypothetical protein
VTNVFTFNSVENPHFHITVPRNLAWLPWLFSQIVDWEAGKPENGHTRIHTHTYYDSEIIFTDFVVDYTVKIK